MKLILVTHNYPFGKRWDFVEDEIPYLEKSFEEIIILSLSDDYYKREDVYIPQNTRVIKVRKEKIDIPDFIPTVFKMFSKEVLQEFIFATKNLKYTNYTEIVKLILSFKYFERKISKIVLNIINEDRNNIDNYLFYDYWMQVGAYTFAKMKSIGKISYAICRTHRVDCFIELNYRPFRREIIKNLNMIFSVSEAGKESIEKNILPYIKSRKHAQIEVARLGVVKQGEQKNPDLKDNEDIPFTIVSCSNIISEKRVDLLVNALALERNRNIRWIHFGSGSLYEDVKTLADSILPRNVNIVFKGFTPKSDIFSFYENNHVDLFVNCSFSEGVPVSIMEALSFGIPVLATSAGGTSEIIGSECGMLIDVNSDYTVLYNEIKKFMEMTKEEVALEREKAYAQFIKYCSAQENYTRFVEKISNIAN